MAAANETKKRKTWVLFIIIPLVTLLVAFLAFSFFTKTFVFAEEPRPVTTEFTYPMEQIIVNLKDGDHYLKTTIALGYGLEGDLQKIESKKIQLQDVIIDILRGKSSEDVIPVKKAEDLKGEIQDQTNQYFDEKIITDVFITEFLVQ